MTDRLTHAAHTRIRQVLAAVHLPNGIGGEHDNDGTLSACSIAAINLALTGELTDDTPACMSPRLATWIICTQDVMGDKERNAYAWRCLLPDAAGTKASDERAMFDALCEALLPRLDNPPPNVPAETAETWRTNVAGLTERLQRAVELGNWLDAWQLLGALYGLAYVEGLGTEALGKALAAGYSVIEDDERTEEERWADELADACWRAWLVNPSRPGEEDDGGYDDDYGYDDE